MEQKGAAHASKEAEAIWKPLLPLAQGLITLFIACLGMMLGCTIGSLVYPSPPAVGAIVGGSICMVIFMCIGGCITGLFQTMMPHTSPLDNVFAVLPHVVAVNAGGYSTFSAILTVHELQHVSPGNRYMTSPQMYVDVECTPGNPIKSTCVKSDGVFNEQFRLHITPACKAVVFTIKDQQLFGASDVAVAMVQVGDVVRMGFPYRLPVPVTGGDGYNLLSTGQKPELIVSFEAAEDYDKTLIAQQPQREEDTKIWNRSEYGSVNYLSTVQFNNSVRLGLQPSGSTVQKY